MTLSNLSDRGTLRGTLQRNNGNYDDLINKPTINGHTLIGNQSGHALGLANEDDIINVEANPLGSATADLHKILVDDTIYSIPNVVVYGTASGAIVSFDDGGNDKPLKSLKVAINPVQSGSGDPSPSNVRPISGWDDANVTRTGKNLFDAQDIVTKSNHTTYTYIEDGYLYYNAGNSTVNGINWYGLNFPCPLTFSGSVKNFASANENANFYATFDDGTQSLISVAHQLTPNEEKSFSVIIGVSGEKLVSLANSWANSRQLGLNLATTQLELGATATDYEPYNGTTYPITWSEAGEVFGGTLDVTNGKLKVRPYYASYNGETLIGPWISSMDVYDPNTPPTTGAQVVDLGGVETEIDISPTQITTLLGNNNIWSDTGDILECVYQRDLNIAINKALSQ